MRYVYGFQNVTYFSGPSPDGYPTWFRSRAKRDAALALIREDAITHGLAPRAAHAGIYPIKRHVASMAGDLFLHIVTLQDNSQ